jgi:hypothetical protein
MDQLDAATGELNHLLEIGVGHDSHAALARYVAPVNTAAAQLDAHDIDGAKAIVTS